MKQFQPILPYNLSSASNRSISLLFVLDGILELLEFVKSFFDTASSSTFQRKKDKVQAIGFYFLSLLKASKVESEEPLQIINKIEMLLQKKIHELMLKKKIDPTYHERLYQKLLFLFDSLFPFLQEAKANENLLFYLIENEKRWNAHLQSKTIAMVLESLFSSSFSELKAVIQEGFTRRGFSSFYKKNEALIDAMEWDETSCLK